MNLNRIAAFTAAAVLGVASLSASAATSINTRTITRIAVSDNWAVIEYTPGLAAPVEGCTGTLNPEKKVTIDWESFANRKTMLATAMLAFATGSNVNFSVSGCKAGYPSVRRVDVDAAQ
ncbi:MAG: hypothetical protein H6983_04595 [Ectothiorhodospiraceae bacterium]|nr:hypothetical protein [Ectothiorhodospiraceae bacterium]